MEHLSCGWPSLPAAGPSLGPGPCSLSPTFVPRSFLLPAVGTCVYFSVLCLPSSGLSWEAGPRWGSKGWGRGTVQDSETSPEGKRIC